MFKLGPFRLTPFSTPRRQRFEAAVVSELDYLRAVYGEDALSRGIERAARSYISDGRRSVIKEAVRRLTGLSPEPRASDAAAKP